MIEQHLPAMFAYAKACARSDEAQDLVQEACKRLLAADYTEITEALVITTIKNIWRDRCASAALRYTQSLGDDTMLTAFVLPQVEEEIYARQIGKDLHDWPEQHMALCLHCQRLFPQQGKQKFCCLNHAKRHSAIKIKNKGK